MEQNARSECGNSFRERLLVLLMALGVSGCADMEFQSKTMKRWQQGMHPDFPSEDVGSAVEGVLDETPEAVFDELFFPEEVVPSSEKEEEMPFDPRVLPEGERFAKM